MLKAKSERQMTERYYDIVIFENNYAKSFLLWMTGTRKITYFRVDLWLY